MSTIPDPPDGFDSWLEWAIYRATAEHPEPMTERERRLAESACMDELEELLRKAGVEVTHG